MRSVRNVITETTRNCIQDGLRKYSRIVAQARQCGMNAKDTGDIVKAMLGDMLGYDPFFEVTTDSSIRGPHADHAILIDGQVKILLVVKSIGSMPNPAHLLRLSGHSCPGYVDWVLLTNADHWLCYRLGVGHDRHPEPIFRIGLMEPRPIEEKIRLFFLFSKEGVSSNALQRYWESSNVLNPNRIAELLTSDTILEALRREIHRSNNFRVEKSVIATLLRNSVILPEALAPSSGSPAQPDLPQCYAYFSDPTDRSTWRLYYRNEKGEADAEGLMAAAAKLSGDLRQLAIPADDLPLVKQRLRQAYTELGVAAEELPAVLQR